jgi:NADP-dependent 3-hydroxy acid dehydrogenase YdfG
MALPKSFDLSGRVAVVTGAGSADGIGFAAAALLGSLGAAVLVTSTTSRIEERVEQLRDQGTDAASTVADLTVEAEAAAVIAAAVQRWGRLDIVVNNAGMVSVADPDFESGDVGSMSPDTWHRSLARNLDTAFLVSRAAVPAMAERGWGRVVMVTSVTGAVMAMRGDVGYATSKAGHGRTHPGHGGGRRRSRRHRERRRTRLDRHGLADAARGRGGPHHASRAQRHRGGGRRGRRLALQPRGVVHHRSVPGCRRRQLGGRGAPGPLIRPG